MIQINIFAFAAQGTGISGSDRIFIEFVRRWIEKFPITIYVDKDGYEMCQRQNLPISKIKFQKSNITNKWGFFINYLARIFTGLKLGFSLHIEDSAETIIYSASEFWMDSLPCVILKLRFRKVKWVAAWYQTAPNPLKGFAEGKREGRYRVSAFFYWFAQLPVKPLIAQLADFVLVNNEVEKSQFPTLNENKRAIVVIGAVDVQKIEKWKSEHKNSQKIYDAVFQGRFHPQKGVVEMIEIWRKVVDKKSDAKLVMIGDGPLMREVNSKIKDLSLEKNITLLGYVFDGDKKYKTFAQSKLVVHPAFYDSGGMAAAEAMAFGLPCIGFKLLSYQSYYPYGMIKAEIGDLDAFAKEILNLLKNQSLRIAKGKEALEMIKKSWSWDTRAKEVLEKIAA